MVEQVTTLSFAKNSYSNLITTGLWVRFPPLPL